jgi:hypothetical protein
MPTVRDEIWTFALKYPKPFDVSTAVEQVSGSEKTVRDCLKQIQGTGYLVEQQLEGKTWYTRTIEPAEVPDLS